MKTVISIAIGLAVWLAIAACPWPRGTYPPPSVPSWRSCYGSSGEIGSSGNLQRRNLRRWADEEVASRGAVPFSNRDSRTAAGIALFYELISIAYLATHGHSIFWQVAFTLIFFNATIATGRYQRLLRNRRNAAAGDHHLPKVV